MARCRWQNPSATHSGYTTPVATTLGKTAQRTTAWIAHGLKDALGMARRTVGWKEGGSIRSARVVREWASQRHHRFRWSARNVLRRGVVRERTVWSSLGKLFTSLRPCWLRLDAAEEDWETARDPSPPSSNLA
ncbi:hypothetical protein NUW54_g1198 [Trametes sanguinea]|uniref:Uncharacterized protein n=1 Tax=Trametes sanguinea TaxID=158606 RepID=A0ACC1Q705_9APHY|nr:hypothetical protein NUW54_g1198 [Trametes sanguinea]